MTLRQLVHVAVHTTAQSHTFPVHCRHHQTPLLLKSRHARNHHTGGLEHAGRERFSPLAPPLGGVSEKRMCPAHSGPPLWWFLGFWWHRHWTENVRLCATMCTAMCTSCCKTMFPPVVDSKEDLLGQWDDSRVWSPFLGPYDGACCGIVWVHQQS